MLEDTEGQTGQIEEATAEETPAGTTELAGEGAETTNAAPEGSTEDLTKTPPAVNLEEEVQFEVAGKTYTMKQAQIVEALEKAHVIAEREKSLTEKEKSMNRDYSQKSQANAQFRKSVETTFGRFPENNELQAMGKIFKAWENPKARQLIQRVLSGQYDDTGVNGSGQNARDPYVQALEQQIAELKEQVGGVTSSIEERETSARTAENNRIWSTWSKSKDSQGIKITQEVDQKMAPFVSALRQAMPDATPEQVLDEAYKHATIDQLKENVAKQTLVSADKAKKQGVIRITPKGGQSSDASKSYKQMLMESA